MSLISVQTTRNFVGSEVVRMWQGHLARHQYRCIEIHLNDSLPTHYVCRNFSLRLGVFTIIRSDTPESTKFCVCCNSQNFYHKTFQSFSLGKICSVVQSEENGLMKWRISLSLGPSKDINFSGRRYSVENPCCTRL